MRNKLIHYYFGTNLDIVWKSIKEDVPELLTAINKIKLDIEKGKNKGISR